MHAQLSNANLQPVHAEAPFAPAQAVRLGINGQEYALSPEPRVTLLDARREYIGLTGAKKRLRPRRGHRTH
jgi:xanthine dehydrogenase YagT iron-sulfur-binding subunit